MVYGDLQFFDIIVFAIIAVFIFPWITGLCFTPQPQMENGKIIDVAVIQPNIHISQKWKPGGVRSNIASLLDISEPISTSNSFTSECRCSWVVRVCCWSVKLLRSIDNFSRTSRSLAIVISVVSNRFSAAIISLIIA